MVELKTFIRQCQTAVRTSAATDALRTLLSAAVADESLPGGLPQSDEDEVLLHACEELTIVMIQLTPNVHFPPHNHHMPALVGLHKGVESNFIYERSGEKLRQAAQQRLAAPVVYEMPVSAIHSVANHGEIRSLALHVYCGDLIGQKRTIWHPQSFEMVDYSDEKYFGWARPLDPTRPYTPPPVANVHSHHRNGA